MWLCLYEPDIPQNTGGVLRLAACLGIPLHIIGPCGYPFDDKRLHRVAMDYSTIADYTYHTSWEAFTPQLVGRRLIALSTKASECYTDFVFSLDDILLLGSESSGLPPAIHNLAHERVKVPMQAGARSLNVGMAAAIIASEALRQLKGRA